jgi:GntR family transcriptional repressor for pyruvate dehydrogenase complex
MALKPVEKILVSDGILGQIRTAIHSGEFAPGQRLPSETKMAGQLSVSRSSLREALHALVHIGYLERRNKGLHVAPKALWRTDLSSPFRRLSIAEIIEVRKIIEIQLCALAAKRANPEDIAAIRESLHRMEAQIDHPAAFVEADHHFHLCVARASKNSILSDFVEKIADLLRDNMALVIEKSTISRRSLSCHQRIFEAIYNGDAGQARRLMSGHLAEIEKEFVKIFYRSSEASSTEEITMH